MLIAFNYIIHLSVKLLDDRLVGRLFVKYIVIDQSRKFNLAANQSMKSLFHSFLTDLANFAEKNILPVFFLPQIFSQVLFFLLVYLQM